MEIYTPADIQQLKKLQDDIVNCPVCAGSDPNCDCIKRYKFYSGMVTSAIPMKYRYADIKVIQVEDLKHSLGIINTKIVYNY